MAEVGYQHIRFVGAEIPCQRQDRLADLVSLEVDELHVRGNLRQEWSFGPTDNQRELGGEVTECGEQIHRGTLGAPSVKRRQKKGHIHATTEKRREKA